MLKKALVILFIIFFVLFTNQLCFAEDMANNVKNAMHTGTNTIVDGTQNLVHDIRNGIGAAENGMENLLDMDNNGDLVNSNIGTTMTANYNATRTSDSLTSNIDNTTMWVWIIVSVATIVIVALVWYYGSQNTID